MSDFQIALAIGICIGGFFGVIATCLTIGVQKPEQDNNTICFDVGCGHRRRG